MKIKLSLEYSLLRNERVDFPIPMGFAWVAGGICLRTDVRDWQIHGDSTHLPEAVRILVEFCDEQVQMGYIRDDWRMEIFRTYS